MPGRRRRGGGGRRVPPVTRGGLSSNLQHVSPCLPGEPQSPRYLVIPVILARGPAAPELFSCMDLAADQKIMKCFLHMRRDFCKKGSMAHPPAPATELVSSDQVAHRITLLPLSDMGLAQEGLVSSPTPTPAHLGTLLPASCSVSHRGSQTSCLPVPPSFSKKVRPLGCKLLCPAAAPCPQLRTRLPLSLLASRP